MWFYIVLIVSMSLSTCPNGCSGHGKCNSDGHCECFKQVGLSNSNSPAFTGYDCSERACPYGEPFSATLDWVELKTDEPITLEGGETSLRMLQQQCSIREIKRNTYYQINIDNYGKLNREGGKASVYSEGNYIGKGDILKADDAELVVKFNFDLNSPNRKGFNMTFKVSEQRSDLSLYYIATVKGEDSKLKLEWPNEYIEILDLFKTEGDKYTFACYNDDINDENEVNNYGFELKKIEAKNNRRLAEGGEGEGGEGEVATTTPEVTTPEVTTPEATTPEVTTPEATTPEATTPEATTPEVTTPEVTTPEAEVTTTPAAEQATTTPSAEAATTTPAVVTTTTVAEEATTTPSTAAPTTLEPTTLEPTLTPCNTTVKSKNNTYEFVAEDENKPTNGMVCHMLYSASKSKTVSVDDSDMKQWLFKKGNNWFYGTESTTTATTTPPPPKVQIKVPESVKSKMIEEPQHIYIPPVAQQKITSSIYIGAKITVTVKTNSSVSRQVVTVISIDYDYTITNDNSRMRLLAENNNSKYLRITTEPPIDYNDEAPISLVLQPQSTENKAHKMVECSNQGLCNRESGECQCFDGFEGIACQRISCPNNCNGNGRCVSIAQSLGDENIGNNKQFKSKELLSCKCDPGRRGPDCSLLECPSGEDPLKGSNLIISNIGNITGAVPDPSSQHRDCSGRGTCDYTTGLCKCYTGYTGEGCQEAASTY